MAESTDKRASQRLPTSPPPDKGPSGAAQSGDTVMSPGGMLTERTEVWDAPGAPTVGTGATRGIVGAIKADITKEYVTAQPNQWYLNLIRVLPFAIDDITTDFGDDLYERIMYDAITNACVTTFKAAVLEDGLNMAPAVTSASDGDYDKAVELLKGAQRMIDQMPADFDNWAWSMLDALPFGNKVAEITYREERAPKNGVLGTEARLQYTLDTLHVKPRHSVGFAVDTKRNVVGMMGLIPGIGMPVYTGNIVIDPSQQPNFLAREKFAILTHRPHDEDPRGSSILRAAYVAWNLKMQLWAYYAKWLTQFASPTLLGYTPEQAMQLPLVDPQGGVLSGTDGGPIMPASPEQAMLNVLTGLMSNSAAVFPGGSKVEWIEMRGQGAPFNNAFRMLNQEITTAIHGQTMTTQSPQYGTQALGSVQENTLNTLIHQAKAFFVRMLRHDILRLWIRYNYGREYEHLAPRCSLGQTEATDFTKELAAFAAAGYMVDASQFPGIDERLALPVRSAAAVQAAEAQQAATRAGAGAGAGVGGAGTGAGGGAGMGAGAGGRGAASQRTQGSQQQSVGPSVSDMVQRVKHAAGLRLDPNLDPPSAEEVQNALYRVFRRAA